jgi:hypothetical protein
MALAIAGYLAPVAACCFLMFSQTNLWHPTISAPTVPQPVAAKVRGRPQLHSATPTSAAVMTKRQEIDHTHHVKHHVKHHGIFTEYHGESSRAAMSFSSFSFCLSDREGSHP